MQTCCMILLFVLHRYGGARLKVDELWTKDSQVSSGVIGPDTKILVRSKTCVYHILIQMSAEMWQVNRAGECYIERAAEFVQDLVSLWDNSKCSHHVRS